MKRILLWSLMALLLAGCGAQLSTYDHEWNPYAEGQTLIFQNQKGNQFYLYVLGTRKERKHVARSFRTQPGMVVYASSYEGARIQRKDLPPSLLRITRTSVNLPAQISISLSDFHFGVRTDQKGPFNETYTAMNREFLDVAILKNERPELQGNDVQQATQVWWSRRHGLLAFELANGTQYVLKGIESKTRK